MNHAPHTALIHVGGSSSRNGFAIAAYPEALLPIANLPALIPPRKTLAAWLAAAGVVWAIRGLRKR